MVYFYVNTSDIFTGVRNIENISFVDVSSNFQTRAYAKVNANTKNGAQYPVV
jgi:hypothetical protein